MAGIENKDMMSALHLNSNVWLVNVLSTLCNGVGEHTVFLVCLFLFSFVLYTWIPVSFRNSPQSFVEFIFYIMSDI
jgi:hypothetical protein